MIAESNLNPYAERWGAATARAKEAIAAGDRRTLQQIIDRYWPDISFGYGQRIVLYHYCGDRSPTVDNCLAVRNSVFQNPMRDVVETAKKLQPLYAVYGDMLRSLIVYNAGHWPGDWYFTAYQQNVKNYQNALREAKRYVV